MLKPLLWQAVCQEEKWCYIFEIANFPGVCDNLRATTLILFVRACILLSSLINPIAGRHTICRSGLQPAIDFQKPFIAGGSVLLPQMLRSLL